MSNTEAHALGTFGIDAKRTFTDTNTAAGAHEKNSHDPTRNVNTEEQRDAIQPSTHDYTSLHLTPAQKDEWDSACTVLPDENEPLCSHATSPPRQTENKARFLQHSSRALHYFYSYVRVSLENNCRENACSRLGNKIQDRGWCKHYLRMSNKEWSEPGPIEFNEWDYFFGKELLPGTTTEDTKRTFQYVDYVRQAAVHRRRLSIRYLGIAMTLPNLLEDERRATEMKRAYDILRQQPSTRHADDQACFNELVYTQNETPVLISQLLAHFQYLPECSAFNLAKAADPKWLEERDANSPEQIELQEYWHRWYKPECAGVGQDPTFQARYNDSDTAREWQHALTDAKQLRNEATHRRLLAGPKCSTVKILSKRVRWAQEFTRWCDDPAQAKNIRRITNE